MNYIILKSDGSKKESVINRYIQQGNSGVDKIFIGWPLGLSTDYGQAVFTLPNQLTNTELGVFKANYPYEADDPENPPSDYDGETCNGWVITLTQDQTIYSGGLFVSFRVIRNGIVQVAFPFTLMINETGVRPDTDSGVTIEQLDSYLLNIQNLVANNISMNVDSALSNTSENPVQNKVVKHAIDQMIAGVYKPAGSKTCAQLNALTKTASMSGNVYNVGDSGTLYDGLGGDIQVRTGDNVCLIYHDSENWYWDNMVGFIDTSAFVTSEVYDDLADEYRSDVAYALDELVIHENKLYKCTTAISTPEDWNSAHWTQTTIAIELGNAGGKLYLHKVRVGSSYYHIFNNSVTAFTSDTFKSWLTSKGFTSSNNLLNCVGNDMHRGPGDNDIEITTGIYLNGNSINQISKVSTITTNGALISVSVTNGGATKTFSSDTVIEM